MQIEAKRIITDGDVDLLVRTAQEVGSQVARSLKTSQIRNIFGEVRQIEMNWREETDQAAQVAYRRIVMLQPKLAYQAKRDRGVEELQEVLNPCIEEIRKAKPQDRKRCFGHFVDFFEAILAYHKAAGGRDS